MAGVQIGLILSFLLLYVLTRTVWVRIIKKEILRIEIHLPLLALCLISKKEKKNAKKETDKLSARAYIRVVAGTLARVRDCTVVVREVTLPCKADKFEALTLVRPFAYQGLIYAVIAYLKTKAKRLILLDNAIISSPDITEIQYYVTVKLSLFNLIYAVFAVRRGIYEEKRARRINYVGE